MENSKFNQSFLSIAKAHPELRTVVIRIESEIHVLIVGDEKAEFVNNWIVKTVGDFLANCPRIKDMVIEDQDRNAIHSQLPQGMPITALDALCSSQSPGRKVGVRIGLTFYDIH